MQNPAPMNAMHRNSPGPPSVPAQVFSTEPTSQLRTPSSSNKSNVSSRKLNPNQPILDSRPLSQIEKSVTHLLVATKQLLETLTQWSRQQASDAQVSDVYVRLGYEFNLACRAFAAIHVDTSDLGNVPDLLRDILESTLSQEASVESLEKYLPRIRDIIINLLHGLKRKQQKLRQKQMRDPNTNYQTSRTTSSSSAGNITVENPIILENNQKNEEVRAGGLVNKSAVFYNISKSASSRQQPSKDHIKPFASGESSLMENREVSNQNSNVSLNKENNMVIRSRNELSSTIVDTFPPPPPPPKVSKNALAALQRGGELERRASRRYSHYQITKHLGASANGVPMLPQNSPISKSGQNDSLESLRAIQNRGDYQDLKYQSIRTTSKTSVPQSSDPTVDIKNFSPPSDLDDSAVSIRKNKPSYSLNDNVLTSSSTDISLTTTDTSVIKTSKATEQEYKNPQIKNNDEHVSSISSSPLAEQLILFLQYKTKVKKFVLPGGYSDLSIARLQLAFIEKFAWNTHHNGVDLPEIYIQDSVSGVRHELEDLSDIKNRSVLVLNIEALDEVKRHIDEGFNGVKKMIENVRTAVDDQQATIQRVSDRQQDTAKEISRIQSIVPSSSRKDSNDSSANIVPNPKKVYTSAQQQEIQALRRDLAILRQSYSVYQSDVQNSMNNVRKMAENVKTVAAKGCLPDSDSGRNYVNEGKKGLDEESDKLVAQVDDLQDTVEDLRKDVVMRGVRPLPRQLESVSKEISQAGIALKKMQAFIKRERPIWTKVWEKELERVCKDQEDMTIIEELIVDLEDDLIKASQTFSLVEEATKEQLKDPHASTGASRALSRGLNQVVSADPISVKEGVLDEVRALQPNHEERIEAIERAQKLRVRELESRRGTEFEKELGSFIGENKLRKSGGYEEVERARNVKDEQIRLEVWERENGLVQTDPISDIKKSETDDGTEEIQDIDRNNIEN